MCISLTKQMFATEILVDAPRSVSGSGLIAQRIDCTGDRLHTPSNTLGWTKEGTMEETEERRKEGSKERKKEINKGSRLATQLVRSGRYTRTSRCQIHLQSSCVPAPLGTRSASNNRRIVSLVSHSDISSVPRVGDFTEDASSFDDSAEDYAVSFVRPSRRRLCWTILTKTLFGDLATDFIAFRADAILCSLSSRWNGGRIFPRFD